MFITISARFLFQGSYLTTLINFTITPFQTRQANRVTESIYDQIDGQN